MAQPKGMSVNMIEKKENLKLKAALARGLITLLAALVLLVLTNYAAITILMGPQNVVSLDEDSLGSYVALNVDTIADFYAEAYNIRSDETTGWYAVIPFDGQFLTILLPERYFESASTVYSQWNYLIQGPNEEKTQYFQVNGTVDTLTAQEDGRMGDWFNAHSPELLGRGYVNSLTHADNLSPYIIKVDKIGGLPEMAAYILSGAAALLILHTAVVFLLAALGRYTRKDKKQPALQALPEAKGATGDEVTALPEDGGDTRDTGGDSASEDRKND